MACLRFPWLLLLLVLPASPTFGQGDSSHATIAFDETGKLEDPEAARAILDDLKKRKPDEVFIIVHGWRVGKMAANDMVAEFAVWVHKQARNETIQVIGVRWPSLLGENEGVLDKGLKLAAQTIAESVGTSKDVKEQKEKLKAWLAEPLNRRLLAVAFHADLPPPEQLNRAIDHLEDVSNVEDVLTMLSYYLMKKRADRIGSTGFQECLSQLQDALPGSRVHLVGHSFGCKVCLAGLGSAGRAGKQVDSVTLIQAAVSSLCFAAKIDDVKATPPGAYAEVAKSVKGAISVTYTKNDAALKIAYVTASQAAGQVGELPGATYLPGHGLYQALGARGIAGVADVASCKMCASGTAYRLRVGLNAIDADEFIAGHTAIRTNEVAWLIWSTARFRP